MKVRFEVKHEEENGEYRYRMEGIIHLPTINGTTIENSRRFAWAEARAQAILDDMGETKILDVELT